MPFILRPIFPFVNVKMNGRAIPQWDKKVLPKIKILAAGLEGLDKKCCHSSPMTLNTSEQWRIPHLKHMCRSYRRARTKKEKGNILTRAQEATGYNRKSLIRFFNSEKNDSEAGAPKKLTAGNVELLRVLWARAGYVCALYLHATLEAWLNDFDAISPVPCPKASRKRLLSVSYKTLERELDPYRIEKPISTSSYGVQSAIKAGIELVEFPRCVSGPGHICVDTVCHGGKTTAGDCVWTLTWTDIYTGFTINRAIWNKGHDGIREALEYCVRHAPFEIIDVNTDNGSEFLNGKVYRLWDEVLPGVDITHSRPYHKNDNAHAEQKNRTHVRDLFLRFRIAKYEYVAIMNRIYRLSNLFRNYGTPCKIVIERRYDPERHRIVRKYSPPQTPVDRLLAVDRLNDGAKEKLQEGKAKINRFPLADKLQRETDAIFAMFKDDPAIND